MEKKIMRLARDLDQFLLDRDPCGYYAAVDSREEGFDIVFQALKGGDVDGFIAYIKEDLSETVKTDSLRPVEKKLLSRLKMLKFNSEGRINHDDENGNDGGGVKPVRWRVEV